MSHSIHPLPFRASELQQPSLSPTSISAMEILISDESNPVFITCSKSDRILAANDFAKKSFETASLLNRPFRSILSSDSSAENSTLFFRDSWYKMDEKAFELNGCALKKITLNHPDDLPGSEIMTGVQNSISMILHRFRSPLTGILGYMDLLTELIESEKEATYLDKALSGISHLSGLLDELEPLTSHTICSESTFFDPSDLMLDLIRSRPELSQRVVVKTKNTGLIHTCNQTLFKILTILLDNAIEYSKDHPGSIVVSMNTPEDIEITNNGTAIPDDLVESLYDPFVSSRSDRMGNGLAIAQTLAKQIGISLTLTSNEHNRITFKLKFPPVDKVVQAKKAI